MTKKELYDRFLVEEKKEQLLLADYRHELQNHMERWVHNREICDKYPVLAVKKFVKELNRYSLETDCLVAIVGCMRDLVLEGLDNGEITVADCSERLQTYHQERASIKEIPEKQINIVLSEFSRKMFNYFIDRYYYLKDEVDFDKKIEKKIAAHFLGKTNVNTLYTLNHFSAASIGTGAYMLYLKELDPLFVKQIGGKGYFEPHSASLEHYLIQRTVNPARKAFPIIVIMFVALLIAAFLELNGYVSF